MFKNKEKPEYRLGNIPLIVLTRSDGGYESLPGAKELEDERMRLQRNLAGLSADSQLIVDKNSGHNIHLDDPKMVIGAVYNVVNAIKHHKRLDH